MRNIITIALTLLSLQLTAQINYNANIELERVRKDSIMFSPNSILNDEEKKNFLHHDYYEPEKGYIVKAKLIKKRGRKFEMKTSTDRLPLYRRYGFVEFTLNDTLVKLAVYKNLRLKKMKEFKNYLFLPVVDGTSSKTTYGSGRYLDLTLPKGKELVIDFNQLYNPYCAYSDRYSCPITPDENRIDVQILAGEKIPVLKVKH